MVLTIWLYALAMVTPTLSNSINNPSLEDDIQGYTGTFGYNTMLGKCDYMDNNGPRVLFYTLGFGLPLILIVACYSGIWRTTTLSSSTLDTSVWVILLFQSSVPAFPISTLIDWIHQVFTFIPQPTPPNNTTTKELRPRFFNS